jgi:hypothetical protein
MDAFSEFYKKLDAYYIEKPEKKPSTKNEIEIIINEILAAKTKM